MENSKELKSVFIDNWNKEDSKAAVKEGWDLYESFGSLDGSPQIQRNDEQGILDSDEVAWEIVANGNEPHHMKALAILKNENIGEYNRVTSKIL